MTSKAGRRATIMTFCDRRRRHGQMARARADGMATKDIAAKFGVCAAVVRYAVRKSGFDVPQHRGRKRIWADCPPELMAEYDWFVRVKRIPAGEVMRMLRGDV